MEHFVIIASPPLVEWSEQSHKAFPASFKERAAALLMSHNHAAGHRWLEHGIGSYTAVFPVSAKSCPCKLLQKYGYLKIGDIFLV